MITYPSTNGVFEEGVRWVTATSCLFYIVNEGETVVKFGVQKNPQKRTVGLKGSLTFNFGGRQGIWIKYLKGEKS